MIQHVLIADSGLAFRSIETCSMERCLGRANLDTVGCKFAADHSCHTDVMLDEKASVDTEAEAGSNCTEGQQNRHCALCQHIQIDTAALRLRHSPWILNWCLPNASCLKSTALNLDAVPEGLQEDAHSSHPLELGSHAHVDTLVQSYTCEQSCTVR